MRSEFVIFLRVDKEMSSDQLDVSRDLKETMDKYSKFMMIQTDFENLNLCGEMILKEIGDDILQKLPSLLELKSIMNMISIHGPMFVERVIYLIIKSLSFLQKLQFGINLVYARLQAMQNC